LSTFTLESGERFEMILAMKMWTPLWNEIVTSSIWEEDVVVRVVWITMLAVKDRNGYVSGSVSSMARIANVDPEDCARAVKLLESPDKRNPNQPNQGRRIQPVEKGWVVINHAKYRDMIQEEYRRNYKARKQAEYRDKKKPKPKGPIAGERQYVKDLENGTLTEP
jgi:hypothetical protein